MEKAVQEGAYNMFLLMFLFPKDIPVPHHFGCVNPKWSDLKLNYTWQESVSMSARILKANVWHIFAAHFKHII